MTTPATKAPTTKDEYEARFLATHRVEGFGLDGVRVHVPCPFCAAPDFIVHGLLETQDAYHRGGTCSECGRSLRVEFTATGSGVTAEMVQTGGDDPPEWAPFPRARTLRQKAADHRAENIEAAKLGQLGDHDHESEPPAAIDPGSVDEEPEPPSEGRGGPR